MIDFWKKYNSWFVAGNLLVMLLVMLQLLKRILCDADSDCIPFAYGITDVLPFRQIPQQTWLELTVLTLIILLIVGRIISAMALYMSSYNIDDSTLDWLSEDEFNHQVIQRKQLHRKLVVSVLQTVAVFVFQYLLMLLTASVYILLLYVMCIWFLCLASINALRVDYMSPKLSTFEFASQTRIQLVVVVLIACLTALVVTIGYMLTSKQLPACVDISQCTVSLYNTWQQQPRFTRLLSYDWVIYALHGLTLCLTVYLLRIFSVFRNSIFRLYKQLLLISAIALLALPLIELVYAQYAVRIAITLYCYAGLLYIFVYMLIDVGTCTEADSITRRKEVVQKTLDLNL